MSRGVLRRLSFACWRFLRHLHCVKITRIETIPIRVPLKPAIAIKSGRGGAHTVSPFLIVKVITDEGIVGLGEVSCTPRWSGEDQFSAKHFIDDLIRAADHWRGSARHRTAHQKDQFPGRAESVHQGGGGDGVVGHSWQVAEHAGLSAAGRRGAGEFVPTKWSVSGQRPEKAAEIAAWATEQGFTKMKVKVGINPDDDVARVKAVREAVGPQVHLGVDANGGWARDGAADRFGDCERQTFISSSSRSRRMI